MFSETLPLTGPQVQLQVSARGCSHKFKTPKGDSQVQTRGSLRPCRGPLCTVCTAGVRCVTCPAGAAGAGSIGTVAFVGITMLVLPAVADGTVRSCIPVMVTRWDHHCMPLVPTLTVLRVVRVLVLSLVLAIQCCSRCDAR